MHVEWDEAKRRFNFEKHRIDFFDAIDVFGQQHLLIRSDRHNEERWTAIGFLVNRLIVVVFTDRDGVRRIISARPANRDERRIYHARVSARSSEGSD